MAVYTEQLAAAYFTATGDHTLYAVPTGKRVIVTDVVMMLTTGAGSLMMVYADSGSGGVVIEASQTAALYAPVHWYGRQALNAGDVLHFVNSGGNAGVRVTGFVFDVP